MKIGSTKLNDNTTDSSVNDSSSDELNASENSQNSNTSLQNSSNDYTYVIDNMKVDDELHIFCSDKYVVLRKTATTHYVEFRNEYGQNIETEVRFSGISLAPDDFYKQGRPCVFPGGWLHLTECITFRPDALDMLPMNRRTIVGPGFKRPEFLPLTELERNLKQGTIVVGADKKPYYQLPVPQHKEIVFGPITDIILM